MIQALGHWLIYLQLVKYFLPKTAEDDWFLFLLGLMQVLIGSVINQSDQVGTWLFLWAMMAVRVLGQLILQREAQRLLQANAKNPESYLGGSPHVDPYDGPFDRAVRSGDGPRSGDDPRCLVWPHLPGIVLPPGGGDPQSRPPLRCPDT